MTDKGHELAATAVRANASSGAQFSRTEEARKSRKGIDPLLSRREAAELLGVTVGTLEVWASTGRYNLPFVKIGRLAKYKMSDLQAFIASRTITVSHRH